MKKIILVLLLAFVSGTLIYSLKETEIKELLQGLSQSRIYVQRDTKAKFIPDWTSEELLAKINAAREASGTSKLNANSKLDQAARARLAVILEAEDIEGSSTGITIEKALVSSGYEASLVGELMITGFFKTNDPITFWNGDQKYRDSLYHTDIKDIGIAIKNNEDSVDVYIILATPRKIVKQVVTPKITWGGPELSEAINKRRVERGVNPLKKMDQFCTIAAIRLNQLLELGKLDGHVGFVPVLERSDLKSFTENYNISEFLIQGYQTPLEAVNAWENTMGHKTLLVGGEYVWGCVYAQNTFGVAIAAY